jgi:hypothetical protein
MRFSGLRENRSPLEEHASDAVAERAYAPPLNAAHLRVKASLDRVVEIEDFFEMTPAHVLGQFRCFLFVGPRFDESDHMEQIRPAEARTMAGAQLSRQRRDNLLTIGCAFLAENILADSGAHLPVH